MALRPLTEGLSRFPLWCSVFDCVQMFRGAVKRCRQSAASETCKHTLKHREHNIYFQIYQYCGNLFSDIYII